MNVGVTNFKRRIVSLCQYIIPDQSGLVGIFFWPIDVNKRIDAQETRDFSSFARRAVGTCNQGKNWKNMKHGTCQIISCNIDPDK